VSWLARLRGGGGAARAPAAPTEQAAIERRLVESRRRLQLLLDHMPDGVLSFDNLGRVEWINPAARLLFQCSAEDTVGRPVHGLIPALPLDTAEAWPDSDATLVAPAGAPRLLLQGLRRDGSGFPLEASVVRLRAGDAAVGMCVCRDMSESQRIERMKHEFVSMVSHELRTPLTSLRGSLALLADGSIDGLPPDAQRLLRMASSNAERLVHLVNDILDFEKLRAGGLRMQPEDCELGALVAQAVESIEGMARQADVALRVLRTDADCPVRADPVRLTQVLGNLLSNAIKYSPPHGTVLVTVGRRSEWARVTVLDQGPGVPADFVARLFEPFEQANDPRHRKQGGTGLGLAISRALMEQMQGGIGIEPARAGEGARFWIELPLAIGRPSTFGALD
jgi:PAS domain S-box-containing protein